MKRCISEYAQAKSVHIRRTEYCKKFIHPEHDDFRHQNILYAASICFKNAEKNLRRLGEHMQRVRHLEFFRQFEPRKLAIELLRPADEPEDVNVDSNDASSWAVVQSVKHQPDTVMSKLDLIALNESFRANATLNVMRQKIITVINEVARAAVMRIDHLLKNVFLTKKMSCVMHQRRHKKFFAQVHNNAEYFVVSRSSYLMCDEQTNKLFDIDTVQNLMSVVCTHNNCKNLLRKLLMVIDAKQHAAGAAVRHSYVKLFAEATAKEFFEQLPRCQHSQPTRMNRLCDLMEMNIDRLADHLQEKMDEKSKDSVGLCCWL